MRFEKIAAVCRRPRTQGVFQIVHHDGERHHVGKNTHKIKYGRLPNQHDKIVKAISAAVCDSPNWVCGACIRHLIKPDACVKLELGQGDPHL